MSETDALTVAPNVFFIAAFEAQTRVTAAHRAPPSAIDLDYSGLSGNKPNQFGNTAFVWQSENLVPFDATPNGQQVAIDDSKDGQIPVELAVQTKNYLVAYAVGGDVKSICSYVTLYPDGTTSDFFHSTISLMGEVTTDLARVRYAVPPGSLPNTWRHSLALWESAAPSYTVPPKKTWRIPRDRDNDVVPLSYRFLANQWYTIAYMAGEGKSQIACIVRFQTHPG